MSSEEAGYSCPSCGKEHKRKVKYCTQCGTALIDAERNSISAGTICPECGEKIRAKHRYCRHCGKRITGINELKDAPEEYLKTCPECGFEVKKRQNFCRKCGNKLNQRHKRYDSVILKIMSPPSEHWVTAKSVIIFFFSILSSMILVSIFVDGTKETSSIVFYPILSVITFCYFTMRKIDYKKQYFYNEFVRNETAKALFIMTFLAIANLLFLFLFLTIMGVNINEAFNQSYLSETTIWSIIIFMCLLPAIFEEAAFRVGIQTDLEKILKGKRAYIVTGILFEMIHLRILLLPFVVTSIYLSYLRYKTKSVWPSMIAHFYYNFFVLSATYLLATG